MPYREIPPEKQVEYVVAYREFKEGQSAFCRLHGIHSTTIQRYLKRARNGYYGSLLPENKAA